MAILSRFLFQDKKEADIKTKLTEYDALTFSGILVVRVLVWILKEVFQKVVGTPLQRLFTLHLYVSKFHF